MTMPETQDGRKKKRPGLATQQEAVLQAAIELFKANGIAETSISAICKKAGITRPTFYRCFTDKHALVGALFEQAINFPVQSLALDMLLSAEHIDEDWLAQLIDGLYEGLFLHADMAEVLFVEAAKPHTEAAKIIDQAFTQIANGLEKEGAHLLNNKLPPLTLQAIMAANQWLFRKAIHQGLTQPAKQETKKAALALLVPFLK